MILREDTTRDAFTALFDWVGALFLFFVGISGFSKTKKPLLLTTYSIRVSAAGTVDNILYSTDHELVTEIVEELNTSIINLQMQGHPWNGNPGVEAFAPRSGDLLP